MARHPGAITHAYGSDPIVVAYGMGVDSTAMLIGLRDRRVSVDLILFADTGSEKPETMAYLPIVQTWLAAHGMPGVTVIKRHSPRAGDTSLHAECLRKRVLPWIASVKVVECGWNWGGHGQAALGVTWVVSAGVASPSISGGPSSSAMASTCM